MKDHDTNQHVFFQSDEMVLKYLRNASSQCRSVRYVSISKLRPKH